MKAVLQRVARASVTVEGECVGSIGAGLLVLVGVVRGDSERDAEVLADRVAGLRVFPDDAGRMNRSALDLKLEALVVSQFTLCADLKKGRRPGFDGAEAPERAAELVDRFQQELEKQGLKTSSGRFGAMMDVELVNRGPATFLLDSDWYHAGRGG